MKKKPTLRRLLIRLGLVLFALCLVSYATAVWWVAGQISQPARSSVQPAHQAFFGGSAHPGFRVEKFTATTGYPVLVCLPEATTSLSEKAALIRRQLTGRGVALTPPGETVATLLILHGRNGIKENYLAVAERFCAAGFRCVIPDLPGHGENPAKFTTYGVLEAHALLKTYREAAEKFGFPEKPAALLGQSMGGSEAIHAAALADSPFQALVVISTFDRLQNATRHQTESLLDPLVPALRLPAEKLSALRTGVPVSEINPAEKAATLTIPTLVIHGEKDRAVPFSTGKALFAALPATPGNQFLPIPNADHHDVLITDFPLYATIADWLLRSLGPISAID